ncbi:armadillo-type protein [Coniochaeta sp. 2T2.1]|nr:armadillo-type protein [Coniochaeta sp. 2T2.1]
MATSLQAQLAKIAANSKSSLNIKATRASHSKSLIFEPAVAAGQTFQAVYAVAHDGFEELCRLDSRFSQFETSLFSEQSQDEDRTQLSKNENEELDRRIDAFLRLVGSRLRLMPAIKAIEWLVRRFRIHEFNTASLIAAFLPYHTIPAFVTLMSILPAKIPAEYRWLDPYIRSLTAPPRAAIVQQTISRPEVLATISAYTLESCRLGVEYPAMISFWAGIMTETVNGMLDKMRSGRRSVQAENDQALLQMIGPTLSDALVMRKVPGLQVASYMVVAVLASKGGLSDAALSSFMEQIVHGWTTETSRTGLVCLSILAQHRSAKALPGKVTKALTKVPELVKTLQEVSRDYRVDRLTNGLALALIDRTYKKGDARGLDMVKAILLGCFLPEKQIRVAYKALLVAAHRIDDEIDQDGQVRKQLGSVLVVLSQAPEELGEVIRATIEEVDFDIEALELKLEANVRPRLTLEAPKENGVEETPEARDEEKDANEALQQLSKPKTVSTCFSSDADDFFTQLSSVFLAFASSKERLPKFDQAPILSRPTAPTDSFYMSFYIRVWTGAFPALARAAALDQVKDRLKADDCKAVDFQALLPYCIAALRDSNKKVRRAAADLVAVLSSLYPDADSKHARQWTPYDKKSTDVHWMDGDATRVLINTILMPALEESVLDDRHITEALKTGLESSKGATDAAKSPAKKQKLSHSTKLSILKALCSHVVHTPFLLVKVRLLEGLNQVRGVSGVTRTELLLPLLISWASLSPEEVQKILEREALEEAVVDASYVDIVVANDKPGLDALLNLIKSPKTSQRPSLLRALFARIRKMWSSMKSDVKFSTALAMLELSQNQPQPGQSDTLATEAADVLQNVELTTDILLEFLGSLQESSKLAVESPANKRRRASSSNESRAVNLRTSPELSAILRKTTFVLELVQSSNPAAHPELLQSLFATLSDLQHLRSVVGSELGYLQNLVLGSLLAMMPTYKNNKDLKIDASVGHGDVLVTCIQRSSSPGVQNAALLLVASLAKTAPDVVLHSVMPIFTFMGSSVLRQADDYSAHVVNQTIKEVIPPLIDTFRKSRRSLVASASELLASFVIAYEHIPSPRKHSLFLSLIENLGPEDFLFAVIAMFVDKYGTTDNILGFLAQIMDNFDVSVQLQSLVKLLDLIRDILKPKPTISDVLLGRNEEIAKDPQKTALKELTLLHHVLGNRRLKAEVTELAERDDMETAKIRDIYAVLLEDILTLADAVKTKKPLYNRCGEALSSLLNLLSTAEFIKAVETLLDRPNIALRQKVLRALELRVDHEDRANVKSRAALLAFLPQLTAVIRESEDVHYKLTAITCVDKIAEKYGKKDLEAVAAAATTIASDKCLGQGFDQLRVMALLCLASLVDVLQEGIVPVLPVAIPKTLAYLRESLQATKPNAELHNASYALMTSLAQHLPYMITGSYLDELLSCSNLSAEAGLDQEANEARVQCLRLLAKLADGKAMFTALEKNWSKAAASGWNALTEYLDVLGWTLDKHSKATISKNIPALTATFMSALDLRSHAQFTGAKAEQLKAIEDKVNDVVLKMIYKLNDAAFRPIFSQLMEWSATGPSKTDRDGAILRQQSVYGFLFAFFDGLKSIVTSYATYIVDSAVKILNSANPKSAEESELWKRVLRTLAKCFEHDQDGFWQAPAHFGAVAPVLVDQFKHAPVLDVSEELIPAVVELANAADSQEHQKELNGMLLKHLRSEQSAVRLAVVLCEQAVTDKLGEDWLSMLPEMLPYISELQDDDDEVVERETHRWIVKIEGILGESLDSMLQ